MSLGRLTPYANYHEQCPYISDKKQIAHHKDSQKPKEPKTKKPADHGYVQSALSMASFGQLTTGGFNRSWASLIPAVNTNKDSTSSLVNERKKKEKKPQSLSMTSTTNSTFMKQKRDLEKSIMEDYAKMKVFNERKAQITLVQLKQTRENYLKNLQENRFANSDLKLKQFKMNPQIFPSGPNRTHRPAHAVNEDFHAYEHIVSGKDTRSYMSPFVPSPNVTSPMINSAKSTMKTGTHPNDSNYSIFNMVDADRGEQEQEQKKSSKPSQLQVADITSDSSSDIRLPEEEEDPYQLPSVPLTKRKSTEIENRGGISIMQRNLVEENSSSDDQSDYSNRLALPISKNKKLSDQNVSRYSAPAGNLAFPGSVSNSKNPRPPGKAFDFPGGFNLSSTRLLSAKKDSGNTKKQVEKQLDEIEFVQSDSSKSSSGKPTSSDKPKKSGRSGSSRRRQEEKDFDDSISLSHLSRQSKQSKQSKASRGSRKRIREAIEAVKNRRSVMGGDVATIRARRDSIEKSKSIMISPGNRPMISQMTKIRVEEEKVRERVIRQNRQNQQRGIDSRFQHMFEHMKVLIFPDKQFSRQSAPNKKPIDKKSKYEQFRDINVVTPFLICEDNIFDRKVNFSSKKKGLGISPEDFQKSLAKKASKKKVEEEVQITKDEGFWVALQKKMKMQEYKKSKQDKQEFIKKQKLLDFCINLNKQLLAKAKVKVPMSASLQVDAHSKAGPMNVNLIGERRILQKVTANDTHLINTIMSSTRLGNMKVMDREAKKEVHTPLEEEIILKQLKAGDIIHSESSETSGPDDVGLTIPSKPEISSSTSQFAPSTSREPSSAVRITTNPPTGTMTGQTNTNNSSKRKLRSSLTNFLPENVLTSLATLKNAPKDAEHKGPSQLPNRRMPRKSILQEKRDLLDFFDQQGIQINRKHPPLNKMAKKNLPKMKEALSKQLLRDVPEQVVQHKIVAMAREKNRDILGEPEYKYKEYEAKMKEIFIEELEEEEPSKEKLGTKSTGNEKGTATATAGGDLQDKFAKLKQQAKLIQKKKITEENQINIGGQKYMSVKEILEQRRKREGVMSPSAIVARFDKYSESNRIMESVDESGTTLRSQDQHLVVSIVKNIRGDESSIYSKSKKSSSRKIY